MPTDHRHRHGLNGDPFELRKKRSRTTVRKLGWQRAESWGNFFQVVKGEEVDLTRPFR